LGVESVSGGWAKVKFSEIWEVIGYCGDESEQVGTVRLADAWTTGTLYFEKTRQMA